MYYYWQGKNMNHIMNLGQQHYTKSNVDYETMYSLIPLYKAYWKGKFTWMKNRSEMTTAGCHRGKKRTMLVYKELHYRHEIPSNWFTLMVTSDLGTENHFKETIWNWRTVSNIKHSSLKLSL